MNSVAVAHEQIYGRRGQRYYDTPVGAPYLPRCQRTVVKRGHVHVCEFVDGHSGEHEEVNSWLSQRRYDQLMAFLKLPVRAQARVWKKVRSAPEGQGVSVMLEEFEAARREWFRS